MENIILKNTLQAIKQGDIVEIKRLKKEVDKMTVRENYAEVKEFSLAVMSEFRKAEDAKLKVVINSVLSWYIVYFIARDIKDECSVYIFENIFHKNGNIRQQTVKMAGNLVNGINSKGGRKKKNEEYFVNFINKVMVLIDEHKEKDEYFIERKKPCVYKSLLLLLEEVIRCRLFDGLPDKDKLTEKVDGYLSDLYKIFCAEDDYAMPMDRGNIYYDAMDMLCAGMDSRAIRILKQALKEDDSDVELYVGLATAYRQANDFSNLEKTIERGYEELLKKFPKWPEEMIWGYMSNRKFLRMIDYRASLYFDQGDKKRAEELYRLLLKLNKGDNQGIRYSLAGLYENLSSADIDEMTEEENRTQNRVKLENLFLRQNKIHNFFEYEAEEGYGDEDNPAFTYYF